MDFNTFLHKAGSNVTHFAQPDTYEIIEQYATDPPSKHQPIRIPASQLDEWANRAAALRQTSEPAKGGSLSLLIHRWDPTIVRDTQSIFDARCNFVFPFRDESHYRRLAQQLSLPSTYMHTFSRRHAGPLMMSDDLITVSTTEGSNSSCNDVGLICQTPDFANTFCSMALSFNPATNCTVGILMITSGFLASLLDHIRDLRIYSGHPLLIPALLYYLFTLMQRRQLRDVNRIVILVQKETGLLERFLRTQSARTSSPVHHRQAKYDDLHAQLVEQHARLTIGTSEFVSQLAKGLTEGLDRIQQTKVGSTTDESFAKLTMHFRQFLAQLHPAATSSLASHNKLLSRIDVQLRVLYNLMQQHTFEITKQDTDAMRTIADAARRDSLEMKGIAILTMTFLPVTAIASVFSMSTFFAMSNDSNHIIVSSQFWIFWAVTIPITASILLGWSLWKHRILEVGDYNDKGSDAESHHEKTALIESLSSRPNYGFQVRKRVAVARTQSSILGGTGRLRNIELGLDHTSTVQFGADLQNPGAGYPPPPTIPFDFGRPKPWAYMNVT